MLESGEDVLHNRETGAGELDPFDVKSSVLSLQFRDHTSLRNTILFVCPTRVRIHTLVYKKQDNLFKVSKCVAQSRQLRNG